MNCGQSQRATVCAMNPAMHVSSRRSFLHQFALGSAALAFGAATSRSEEMSPLKTPAKRSLGVALMGLGGYSAGELAPALQTTRHCHLAGVITGDPAKGRAWSRRYGFPEKNIYTYDTVQHCATNADIDIIYVVTPPGLHRDHVLAAARAGKHVICEKPMAVSVAECDEMIAACRAAGVKLSIGYRLAFEPHHLELDRLARTRAWGVFKKIAGSNGFRLRRRTWRVDKKLAGGGPLMDMGIYVIQAAVRAAAGATPVAVAAHELPKTDAKLFNEVEESLRFRLEFPEGEVCEGATSYAENSGDFRAEAEKGWIAFSPAFSYRGVSARTQEGPLDVPKNVPQQALQMDDFAACILNQRATPVPGEMGRQHLAIIEAIYEAARSGRRVNVRA
jgi:Predicted dehydrogenases and related proteins